MWCAKGWYKLDFFVTQNGIIKEREKKKKERRKILVTKMKDIAGIRGKSNWHVVRCFIGNLKIKGPDK